MVLVLWNCDHLAKHHELSSWTTLHDIQHIRHHPGQPTLGGYHLEIVTGLQGSKLGRAAGGLAGQGDRGLARQGYRRASWGKLQGQGYRARPS